MNNSQFVGVILEEQTQLTLDDISTTCCVQTQFIIELVEEGILTPQGSEPHLWHFTGVHIHRVKTALNLQRDLGINLAGIALAIELLDEVKALRKKLNEHYYNDVDE